MVGSASSQPPRDRVPPGCSRPRPGRGSGGPNRGRWAASMRSSTTATAWRSRRQHRWRARMPPKAPTPSTRSAPSSNREGGGRGEGGRPPDQRTHPRAHQYPAPDRCGQRVGACDTTDPQAATSRDMPAPACDRRQAVRGRFHSRWARCATLHLESALPRGPHDLAPLLLPKRSSRCAHTPPPHTKDPQLVHTFRPATTRNTSSAARRHSDQREVAQVREVAPVSDYL